MARVQLITTGVMEERALGKSLARLFPEHGFVSRPHLDGFTSARLPPPPLPSDVPRNLDKLAATLIGIFAPGNRRDRPRPDFVVAVDDVELVNADDPARITAALRETLQRQLATWPASARALDRLREALRLKVSFHLMAPMTEAYFFADAAAFDRATAPAPSHPNLFDPATDVEAFMVDDPDYLDPPADRGSRWRTQGGRQGHPKRYLLYLTESSAGGQYRESEHGAHALADLDWPAVVRQPDQTRFARSLLVDLVDMLGLPNREIDAERTHPVTWPPPPDPVLRNL
ncbi:MAG: hypothetical protein AAGF11_20070 [Myxococcota bacterium]